MKQVLAPRLEPGHLVILDNLSAHKVDGVRRLIEARGASVFYLPPYSPDFNPIEMACSKIKQLLRGVKAGIVEQLEPHRQTPSPQSRPTTQKPSFNTAGIGYSHYENALDEQPVTVRAALTVSRILWPEFIEENGCVLLGWHSGSNPPPASDSATGWEAFVNHTHIFDEFDNDASHVVSEEVAYNEFHPDFLAACDLGQQIAKLWALKLKLDFPSARFRVYYTQYDNPIVRFHKVRDDEPFWISDEALQHATDSSFRNALIYDTSRINLPTFGCSNSVH